MFMWVQRFSQIYAGVTKKQIWQAWSEVEDWPKWDHGLESCSFIKSVGFNNGGLIQLKPNGGPKVKLKLFDVLPNQGFSDACRFLGATMTDVHILEDTDAGLKITNNISVRGPLSWLWVKLVAQGVAQSVPEQTQQLVEYVRARHG